MDSPSPRIGSTESTVQLGAAEADWTRTATAHTNGRAEVEAHYRLALEGMASGRSDSAALLDNARALHAFIEAQALGADGARCRSDGAYAAACADALYARDLPVISGVLRALAFSQGVIDLHGLVRYALALQHQGRTEEACQFFRAADNICPSAEIHQFLIYPALFGPDRDAGHYRVAREWAQRFAGERGASRHANPDRLGRKLRIGYVAPQFANSQLAQFIAPVLENHDPSSVSVTLYPADASMDTTWPSWIDVHPLGQLDDPQASALIREDSIDVLVDCWGHTFRSRLTTFGHRPAPVQVAWINFIETTGLDQIDYVLHAGDPAGGPRHAELFTEQIWPIGPVFTAFRPAKGRLDPASTPALRHGFVTFGSFNHPAKLSDDTLDAWAAILQSAPASRLLLKYRYFIDPVLCSVTRLRLAGRGVEPERVLFAAQSKGEDYFRAFQDVDLMLDSWPAPGSTTTLDAISNGVPVLCLAQPNSSGHYVSSILRACGLDALIASNPNDYVDRAIQLASDIARLDALRASVRPGFDTGPLSDEVGFTRRIEIAFEEMFDLWFAGSAPMRAYG